jgi:hypothetical protein
MDTKKWYYSKTIWGILIALLGFVLSQMLKVDIKLPESDVLTATDIESVKASIEAVKNDHASLLSQIMVIVGTLLGVYGRLKASTKVT